MGRELSTSLSDSVLALLALRGAFQVLEHTYLGAGGLALVGTAASLGALRFFSSNPSASLIQWHWFFSWLSSFLGTSLIAAAYHRADHSYSIANLHLTAGITLILLHRFLRDDIRTQTGDIIAGAALISTLLVCLFYYNPYGIIGAVLFISAGIVIGTKGKLWKIPRVDIFHYALALGVVAMTLGLLRQPMPIFYRPS